MFDMGPYYLTALVHLLGPIRRVTGVAQTTFPARVIGSPNRFGEEIPVEIPTHVQGLFEFERDCTGVMVTSFDVWHSELPRIEIYGTEGTLAVPDPNYFGANCACAARAPKVGRRWRRCLASLKTGAGSPWRIWRSPCARTGRTGRLAIPPATWSR